VENEEVPSRHGAGEQLPGFLKGKGERGSSHHHGKIKIPAASCGLFRGNLNFQIPLTPFFKGGISVVTL